MLHKITFGLLSAMVVDFVDHRDGFLFLRMVGAETAINALWAKLSAREGRGKTWASQVRITLSGQDRSQGVAAQKGTTYRTLRARLSSGMIDLALVHPLLTVAEDTERGFYLLTYEDGLPSGFFERLNSSLSIPLKPDWAEWLWIQGQQPQSWLALQTKTDYEGGQRVEKEQVVEAIETPITRLESSGQVTCYQVRCHGRYKAAWLHLIRARWTWPSGLRPSLK